MSDVGQYNQKKLPIRLWRIIINKDTGAGLYFSGSSFSTNDQDADEWRTGSCASLHGVGWWFNNCTGANLNGQLHGQPGGGYFVPYNYTNITTMSDDYNTTEGTIEWNSLATDVTTEDYDMSTHAFTSMTPTSDNTVDVTQSASEATATLSHFTNDNSTVNNVGTSDKASTTTAVSSTTDSTTNTIQTSTESIFQLSPLDASWTFGLDGYPIIKTIVSIYRVQLTSYGDNPDSTL